MYLFNSLTKCFSVVLLSIWLLNNAKSPRPITIRERCAVEHTTAKVDGSDRAVAFADFSSFILTAVFAFQIAKEVRLCHILDGDCPTIQSNVTAVCAA